MTNYLIAQLDEGSFGDAESSRRQGWLRCTGRPSRAEADTSYGMGWFVGPVNGIPAVFHQGETFTFHTNIVLMPESDQGVVVLMNAENSLDLFVRGRMGTVAEGVASLLNGDEPPSPPSSLPIFIVYTILFGIVVLQVSGMIRWAGALRRRRVPAGRLGPKLRIAGALALSLIWAFLVLVLVPKQLGVPLLTLAEGLPDLAYILFVSGVAALGWGVARTVWAIVVLRRGNEPGSQEGGVQPA